MRHTSGGPQRDRGSVPRTDKAQPAPARKWVDSTCRGWWAAMAPGLFTAGAGGLCSSWSGYSTMEKAARGKVLDEHRTADTLLDEAPAAQSGQGLGAGLACSQPPPTPAPKCCQGPPVLSPLLLHTPLASPPWPTPSLEFQTEGAVRAGTQSAHVTDTCILYLLCSGYGSSYPLCGLCILSQ